LPTLKAGKPLFNGTEEMELLRLLPFLREKNWLGN
jgi:hypothetical protein